MNSSIFKFLSPILIGLVFVACESTEQQGDSQYTYESVDGDPFGLRLYTLDNGLKVYISENHKEPRIQTNIAVRTGSKQDPADATGLAHYLEHMLFKGTSKLGALNWEEEQVLLQKISDHYELLRATKDSAERKHIYHVIDSISGVAAKLVASNEYDKLLSSLGAQGTNAYTSNERTVYINDIPSNELEKWLAIESERFGELVLRLFHTELEAVYEEFNRTQDSDYRQAYYKLMDLLFPTHPYGQQTTIGTGEHLKNPSMEKIHAYFKDRYVPNNMAIILAGDLDPEKTIAMVDKYFGHYERQPLNNPTMPVEAPITAPVRAEVKGSDAEFAMVAYRLDGAGSKDALYVELMDGILSNGTAGLVDLNLNQQQKVLGAWTTSGVNEDYSYLWLNANNRQGQSLAEVEALLVAQIDSVKQGRFDDWMIEAVVRKFKKDLMERMENNNVRAYLMSDAFILGLSWEDMVNRYDRMQAITKDELVAWANEKFQENYAVVHKTIGEKDVYKVDKPEITQVSINRDTASAFFNEMSAFPETRLEPQFLDFDKAIKTAQVKNEIPLRYVHNDVNDIYKMYYLFDMGKNHMKRLPLAFKYLPYLGTSEMSPADVQREMFKLGLSFDVYPQEDQSYVVVSGLQENFEEGLAFFEKLLTEVVPDEASYQEMVKGILKERADKKLNKGQILFGAMGSYAKYGPKNPFNNVIPEEELKSIDPAELIHLIQNLNNYEHRILFYGPQSIESVAEALNLHHQGQIPMKAIPPSTAPEEIATTENQVFFTDYDMVQTELMMYHQGPKFDVSIMPDSKLFSEYFGGGLSSIVFQEIRESRALAYSAYAGFTTPSKADKHHYVFGYIGSQVNKLGDATNALLELMSDLPRADAQFEQSKLSALKKIETNRTTGSAILFAYESAQDRGLDYDINQELYPAIKETTFDDLQQFFDQYIKNKHYTYVVIGKKSDVDMEALSKLGPVKTLTLEELFGY